MASVASITSGGQISRTLTAAGRQDRAAAGSISSPVIIGLSGSFLESSGGQLGLGLGLRLGLGDRVKRAALADLLSQLQGLPLELVEALAVGPVDAGAVDAVQRCDGMAGAPTGGIAGHVGDCHSRVCRALRFIAAGQRAPEPVGCGHSSASGVAASAWGVSASALANQALACWTASFACEIGCPPSRARLYSGSAHRVPLVASGPWRRSASC